MTQQEIRSSFDSKVRKGLFRPVSRYIWNVADREDRLAESVAMTFEMFQRYAERGQVLDDAVLVHSCRQRAVDLGRRFVRDDAQPRRDVMHPTNFRDGHVAVYRLDGLVGEDGDFLPEEGTASLVPGLATALQVNPQRDIISAVDLEAWVMSLAPADRELLALRQAGSTLADIAYHLDMSISKAFSRLKSLGLILAERAELPIPGTVPAATQ